jgi:hypothetical protein
MAVVAVLSERFHSLSNKSNLVTVRAAVGFSKTSRWNLDLCDKDHLLFAFRRGGERIIGM